MDRDPDAGSDFDIGLCRCSRGERLNGVEDLDVTGTAAQVSTEVSGCLVACEFWPVLVDQSLGPHDDARRAEAALQRSRLRERGCKPLAFVGIEAFQRGDLLASCLLERCLARHHRFTVDENDTATALA